MSGEHDVALANILKWQHKIMEALEAQTQQISTIRRTLEDVLDELRILSEEREK